MSQQAFDRFVEPARKRPEFWRILVGLFLITFGWLVWTAAVMGTDVAVRAYGGASLPEAVETMGQQFTSDDPAAIALMLATFIGIWPVTWGVVRLLHGRSFGTLLSAERRLRLGQLGAGIGLALLLWVVATILGLALVGWPDRTDLAVSAWAVWVVPLAALVFLQSAGEELLFRGYLLQQLAALWRSPLVWGFLPAFLFGLAHLDPGRDLLLNVLYVSVTLLFGLIAAVLVWRTGGLGAAMGLHAGNNFGAIGLTGLEGVASGSQLWVYDAALKTELVVIDLVLMTLILLWLISPACPRPFRAKGGRGGSGRAALYRT